MPSERIATISRFESLLMGSLEAEYWQTLPSHTKYDALHTTLPAKRLLSFLNKASRLALRCVSSTTKVWVETGRQSLFSTLYTPFPLSAEDWISPTSASLHRISALCEDLVVHVAASKTPLMTAYRKFSGSSTLVAFPALTHLRVRAPSSDSFYPLLAFRMLLQAVDASNLTHFTVAGLPIEGVQALRWGPFSSYIDSDWSGSVMWRRLTSLEISLIPSTGPEDLPGSEEGMQGLKILHDWLCSFAENKLHKVRIEWIGGLEGPNPFLLDDMARIDDDIGAESYLSQLRWKGGCKEIWLGGVTLGPDDVEAMAERVRGLKRVMVRLNMIGWKIGQEKKKVISRGHEWVVMDLQGAKEKETILERDIGTQKNASKKFVGKYSKVTGPHEIQGQIRADWSRNEMSGEGGIGGEAIVFDDDEPFSASSRELLFFLDEQNEAQIRK
jgi:hypothetical protein